MILYNHIHICIYIYIHCREMYSYIYIVHILHIYISRQYRCIALLCLGSGPEAFGDPEQDQGKEPPLRKTWGDDHPIGGTR